MKKLKYPIPALILGMSVNGLGVARSLSRKGVSVLATDCQLQDRPGTRSRHAQFRICPHPQKNPESCFDFLADWIGKSGGQAVLLPTSDLFVSFLHSYRDRLASFAHFAMPQAPMMEQLLTKLGQFKLAKKYQLPVPETAAPQNIQEVRDAASRFQYPVLIKGLNTIS